jgi:hypothetical protein
MPAGSGEYRNCPVALLRHLDRYKIELVRQCIVSRANMGRMQDDICC